MVTHTAQADDLHNSAGHDCWPPQVPPVAGAFAALPALPAGAAPDGSRGPARTSPYQLGDEQSAIFPEGITVQDRFFYVSSTTTGAVLRGDLREPGDTARVFLEGGQDGRTDARGLAATEELLLVAGGRTGTLFVYDRQSGELLGRFSGGGFVNDVRVAPNGDAYATDSARDVVYRIPAAQLTSTTTGRLTVFSPASENDPLGQFNANGIAVTPNGLYLIVVQTDTGRLFRISTASRQVQEIDLGGQRVTNGDGIVLQGRTLYVVRNASQAVSEVRLSGDLTRGRVVQTVTDPSFRFPTTAALAQGRLLVVNSQLNNRTSPVDFTVSSIKRP